MPDWLHIVDLTIIPECSASALVELCGTDCWPGDNFEDRLHRAYVGFIAECRRYKVRNLLFLFGKRCFSGSRGLFFSQPLGKDLTRAFLPFRKHLYPGGPNTYPTIAQKHFNAAVLCNNLLSKG